MLYFHLVKQCSQGAVFRFNICTLGMSCSCSKLIWYGIGSLSGANLGHGMEIFFFVFLILIIKSFSVVLSKCYPFLFLDKPKQVLRLRLPRLVLLSLEETCYFFSEKSEKELVIVWMEGRSFISGIWLGVQCWGL